MRITLGLLGISDFSVLKKHISKLNTRGWEDGSASNVLQVRDPAQYYIMWSTIRKTPDISFGLAHAHTSSDFTLVNIHTCTTQHTHIHTCIHKNKITKEDTLH